MGKKLAADIAYNQYMFHGKKDYWFQPQCEKLGWDISDNLARRWKSVLILACIDQKLILESTRDINGSWGTKRGDVKKSFTKAIKEAIDSKRKILYPSTFALFNKLFSSSL